VSSNPTQQLYGGDQFHLWRKPEYPEKITDLQQVTDIMLYRVHISWVGFELTTLVVIGTDCICSYRFTYWSSDTYEWQLWRDITQCVMYRTLVNIRTFFLLKTKTCCRSVIFSGYSGFLHKWNWSPPYSWNIVESGVGNHAPRIRNDYSPYYWQIICGSTFCWYWMNFWQSQFQLSFHEYILGTNFNK
jgi:hypothetical protein